jgi:anti-sigma28 factor (negative regulator of flagellin synthesis)
MREETDSLIRLPRLEEVQMKVNPSAGYEQYKTYVQKLKSEESAPGKAARAARGGAAANTDKVTISGDGAARAEFGRVAASLAAEVEGAASPERLNRLKAAVEDGSYLVPAEALADAILGYEE